MMLFGLYRMFCLCCLSLKQNFKRWDKKITISECFFTSEKTDEILLNVDTVDFLI